MEIERQIKEYSWDKTSLSMVVDFFQYPEQGSVIAKLLDRPVVISIRNPQSKRSVNQNNYYWGIVVQYVINHFKEYNGEDYTKDDIHAYHLSEVVRPQIKTKEVNGKTIILYHIQRPSQMTKMDFVKFVETIRDYWSLKTNGTLIIPDPQNYV